MGLDPLRKMSFEKKNRGALISGLIELATFIMVICEYIIDINKTTQKHPPHLAPFAAIINPNQPLFVFEMEVFFPYRCYNFICKGCRTILRAIRPLRCPGVPGRASCSRNRSIIWSRSVFAS
jgi:hypothetical protein